MASLTILIGAPGSGKSTWASGRGMVLSTDALRDRRDWSPALVDEVYDRVFDDAVTLLRAGHDVVLDTPGTSMRTIRRALNVAAICSASARFVVIDTPPDVCIQRQAMRVHPVPPARVRALCADVEGVVAVCEQERLAPIQRVPGV